MLCVDQLQRQHTGNRESWMFAVTKNQLVLFSLLVGFVFFKQSLEYCFKISFPVGIPEHEGGTQLSHLLFFLDCIPGHVSQAWSV